MRWKLVAGNVLAVVLTGLIAWLWVRGSVADALARDVDGSVERSVGLFATMRTAEGDQFTNLVSEGAEQADLRQIFSLNTEPEQRAAASVFANRYAQELGRGFPRQRPRAADVVAITDARGLLLGRNIDASMERGRNLRQEYDVVEWALGDGRTGGHVARDFLKYDSQKWYDVVVAPITGPAGVVGALLVGYEIADSIAREDHARLGADVGYLIRDGSQLNLHSLSFGTQADKDALRRWANSPEANLGALFNTENPSGVRNVVIGGDTWRVSAMAMPTLHQSRRAGETRPGFVVLQNLTAARAPAGSTTLPILILALAAVALVIGYNLTLGNYLERPIEQMEEGLLRIINGDRDHRIDLQHAEMGGVVYRINQLVSELTGAEEEADESGRISHPPPRPAAPEPSGPLIDDSGLVGFDPSSNPEDAKLAQQLAGEPENDYYERLRREYLEARTRAGQGGDGMTHEQFVNSVRASEQQLAQQHAATLVRFQVQLQGNQVIFRAIPIR